MAWAIGIDEAGYGPNLGPLVQSAVAVRGCDPETNLWKLLHPVARRASDPADERLLIDDSKAVNQGPDGLAKLERGVHAAFGTSLPSLLKPLLFHAACNGSFDDIAGEPWFSADDELPVALDRDVVDEIPIRWRAALSKAGVEFAAPRCVVTPAPRFNEVLSIHGTKAAVTGRGIIALIADFVERIPDEPLLFVIDKLGGRNFYAPMIQTAIPNGWVVAVRESAGLSEYSIEGVARPIRLVFRPRAESEHMTVALASMLSKYLREVFMRQFNRYWLTHVPNLKPTAGYPGDAARFFRAIRPAVKRLGFAKDTVWRQR